MKPRHLLRVTSIAAAMLLTGSRPALPDTIVLDADDVTDWVRVFSSETWKQKDACLHPNSLVKFDLSQITDPNSVIDARLHLFVERVETATTIELWHVEDDSWSYAHTEPVDLWYWPTRDLISTQACDDTTSFSVDVTEHLIEVAQIGSQAFSFKIVDPATSYSPIRIASPLAPIERMRPRIIVEFFGPPAPPPIPDLAASPADLRLVPMRPVPGESATIEARVRNIGAMDCWDIPVAFYDGLPSSENPPIGIWIIPHLASGGGADYASAFWTTTRGLHEIHVVVDPEESIYETDESNNSAIRPFLIADPLDYVLGQESFEYPGRVTWHADFDAPKQFDYAGPKSFYISRSGAEAYHGESSMELYLDGTADDGTIWVETAVPVNPNTCVDARVDFEIFRYQPDIAFIPVATIALLDPEKEGDFVYLWEGSYEGWWLHTHEAVVFTGPYDLVHIAVGLTCTWETPGTFFLDLVQTRVEEIPAEGVGDGARSPSTEAQLYQNAPNPFGPRTTIAYRLGQPSPVSLQIFDALGRLVTTLIEGQQDPGFHRLRWDGRDTMDRRLPAGVYFYRLETSEGTHSRRLLLAR